MFDRLSSSQFNMDLFVMATAQLYRSQVLDALSHVQCRVIWERGLNDGRTAGTWFYNNEWDEEMVRTILQGIKDGDPLYMDQLPTPRIGGEFADEPTWDQIVYEELSIDLSNVAGDYDDWLEAYESGFHTGAHDEITEWLVTRDNINIMDRIAKEQGHDEDD